MTRGIRWIRSDGRGKPEVLRTNVDMGGESGLRRMPDCMVCTDCTLQQDPAQIGQTRLTRGMAQNPRRKDRCVESWTWEERVMAQAVASCCPGCGYTRSGDELGSRERLRAPMSQGTHSKWDINLTLTRVRPARRHTTLTN